MFENSFSQSVSPTLRYICPKFSQCSPLHLLPTKCETHLVKSNFQTRSSRPAPAIRVISKNVFRLEIFVSIYKLL